VPPLIWRSSLLSLKHFSPHRIPGAIFFPFCGFICLPLLIAAGDFLLTAGDFCMSWKTQTQRLLKQGIKIRESIQGVILHLPDGSRFTVSTSWITSEKKRDDSPFKSEFELVIRFAASLRPLIFNEGVQVTINNRKYRVKKIYSHPAIDEIKAELGAL
jgi:hypothetical protein